MMTLDEAARSVGCLVEYRPGPWAEPELGTITAVNDRYVFVRYGRDRRSKATHPSVLQLAGR